jgi:hypothetical protein
MIFRYPISLSQYGRFQHSTNDAELHAICAKAGVKVTGEQLIDGVETWYFSGRCKGTMALVRCDAAGFPSNQSGEFTYWECVIRVQSKPWWLPWFVLDWGFKEALK